MLKNIKENSKLQQKLFVAIVLALTILFLAYQIYVQNYKENEIARFEDSDYSLVVRQIGNADIASKTTNCQFILEKDGEVVNTYKFVVSNNGDDLNEDNFSVEWMYENIRVIASGKEQKDIIYFLNYSK